MAKLNHITIEDNYGFGTFYGKKLDADKKLIESINQNYNFPNTSFSKDNIHLISLKQSNATKSIEELLGNEILSLSIKIEDDEHIVNAKTGNFIGVIYDAENNLKIEITSRFGNRFLQHMLNYINNIFIPDISFSSKKDNKKEHSQYQFILAQLFIQSLEKGASIFGLPKIYITQDLHAYKIRGKLNIPDLISYNIPIRKKLHSTFREQKEVQEIIDVLYCALSILDKKFRGIINARILGIKNLLKEKHQTKLVSSATIQKALHHKALLHPSYQAFKPILKYAEMIIKNYDMTEDDKGKLKSKAYLFDVSELFEIYIEKLLKKGLEGWTVSAQEKIKTYEETFFEREIRPDLVLKKDNQVLVFDTKYKRMNYNGKDNYGAGDVDRNDFFQIHTYMAHYFDASQQTQRLAGGLLYPIEGEYKKVQSDNWLGNEGKFVIDGIALNGINDVANFNEEIPKRETAFIERITELINN